MTLKKIKFFAKDWIPPIVIRLILRFRERLISFEGDFSTWNEASAYSVGYESDNILNKVLDATLKVRLGEYAFERDSVLFNEIEYHWPVISGFMMAAMHSGGKLNVLDFGGALGSSYFQYRAFLDTLTDVKWNVVEQSHYVQVGQSAVQDDRLRFYSTIDACLKDNQPDMVLLSSVLQYLSNPNAILDEISTCGASVLIIDRTPFSNHADEHIVIQKVPKQIYDASYPMRIFSWEKFCADLQRNWQIIAIDISPEGYVETDQGLSFCFKGMVLHSKR